MTTATTTTRERLPNRRRQVTDSLHWPPSTGARIHLSAGLTGEGRILEVFLRGGGKVGSERDFLLDDVAVLVSLLLQRGETLAGIAHSLGRLPDGSAASVVGAIVASLRSMPGADDAERLP